MTTPTVTDRSIAREPVTRDHDFADSLASACQLEPPSQRDLVILSLLRCPKVAAERRGS